MSLPDAASGLVPSDRPAPQTAGTMDTPTATATVTATPAATRTLTIEFTGSGSEYFRIWIVNLLLSLVTLSLYHPFAKARRLRYFHGNTRVGGFALGFQGDPWKMLRGYLLMLVFVACYGAAGQFAPLAGAVAGVALALLWPVLWQSSLRFRLANTTWRGLRLRFDGSVAGAYAALLPLLVPGAAFLVLSALGKSPDEAGASGLIASLLGLLMLVVLALFPLLLARLKRYQHGHYHLAGDTTTLHASTRRFYSLWLRTSGIGALPLVLMALGFWLLVRLGAPMPGKPASAALAILMIVMVLLFYALMFSLAGPYFSARLQDLVWGNTRSPRLRFESRLGFVALAGLTFKNLLLTVLTLGLYRPFAAINTARLRLEAVQVQVLGDVDRWLADAHAGANDAAGDAAGDLLGMDVGL